jgi:hypothetical protein
VQEPLKARQGALRSQLHKSGEASFRVKRLNRLARRDSPPFILKRLADLESGVFEVSEDTRWPSQEKAL